MKALTNTLACAFVAASNTFSQAQDLAPFQTGYIHDFASDIDDGGEVSNHFFHISGGIPLYRQEDQALVALTAAYHLNDYSFSGGPAGSFAALSPWEDIHSFRLGAFIQWKWNEDWDLFVLPGIRSSAESGADLSDSITGSGLVGLSYKVSDTLTIGPGIGVVGQIEDSVSVFPILVIDWQFANDWSLTTGPIVGATQGPGLAIKWQIQDDLRFTFGARSEKLRFRLDASDDISSEAIGEDNSIPIFGILTWQATEHIQGSLIAGINVSNDLILDDSKGKRISREDVDPAPFLGLNLGYSF